MSEDEKETAAGGNGCGSEEKLQVMDGLNPYENNATGPYLPGANRTNGEQYSAIPDELRALSQWVSAGADKAPINPRTGYPASATDPTTWGTYEEADRLRFQYPSANRTSSEHRRRQRRRAKGTGQQFLQTAPMANAGFVEGAFSILQRPVG